MSREIDELHSLLGKPDQADASNKLERALRHWQDNYLAIIPQLYRARIQERQAESLGALIVVQRPIPGTALSGSGPDRQAEPAVVAFIPISLGLAVIFAAVVDGYHKSRSVPQRLLEEGIVVLAVVTVLPPKVSRAWLDLKKAITKRRNEHT